MRWGNIFRKNSVQFSVYCFHMAFIALEKVCFSKAKVWIQSNQSSPGTCMKQSLSVWIKTQRTCSRNNIGNWSRGRWFIKLQVSRISWLCFLSLCLLWGMNTFHHMNSIVLPIKGAPYSERQNCCKGVRCVSIVVVCIWLTYIFLLFEILLTSK